MSDKTIYLHPHADFVSLQVNSLNKQKNWTNLPFVKFSIGFQHHNIDFDRFLENNSEKRRKFLRKHIRHCRPQAAFRRCPDRMTTYNPWSTFPGFLSSRQKKEEYAYLFHVRVEDFFPLFIKKIDEKE